MKSSMNDVLDKVEQINKVGVIGLVAPASSRPGASATTYVPLLIMTINKLITDQALLGLEDVRFVGR